MMRLETFTITAALLVIGLMAGSAYADSYAVATDNIQNGFVAATAGVTFSPVLSNSSSAASFNGSGVSFAANGPNPDAPISATGAAAGRPNESVSGPGYYILMGSNGTGYSWGDAIINQDQTATTTIRARNAAETNISGGGFGNADGRNTWSMPLSVNVAQCPAGGCTISVQFDADPFIHSVVDASAGAGSVARGILSFSVTLTNVANGATVFSWTPNGSVGSGIVGGTESVDAENLNLTVAAFAGEDLTHSGPYGAGVFGHYAAVTNALAAGTYSLSFTMSETTDVTRVDTSGVPEPETNALISIGLAVLGVAARRRLGFARN